MNPIKLSEQLKNTLVHYMTTTFDVNRDGQEKELAQFIKNNLHSPGALFAGPYLEFTPPYTTGRSLQQLAQQGVVAPQLLTLPCFQKGNPLPVDAPLYTHQETAIRKLCAEKHNIVVSSGTGSGKTESFLIPLLNDLILDPSPGVRAVLVYPLNALVNDQLDRLRLLLQDTDITFGRYTSELEEKGETAEKLMTKEWEDMEPERRKLFKQYPLPNEIIGRNQIREQGRLPQILITNYAMLEYLLLRPQDNPLFAQGKWKFIVLDEAHTYAGAQGIEVGLLVRRLKHRLGHSLRCIATSATLTQDDAAEAQAFAQALFGEPFAIDDIIFGQPNKNYVPPAAPRTPPLATYTHPRFDELLQNVRQDEWESADEMALLMAEIGFITDDELSWAGNDTKPPAFLYKVLQGNVHLTHLRQLMVNKNRPIEVKSVAQEIFPTLPAVDQTTALYHLIELASMARPEPNQPSLLPARYHLFVRSPQGIWACLNPTCPDHQGQNQWSKLFAAPRETCDACAMPVYPVLVCRTCGQIYLRLYKIGEKYLPNEPELTPIGATTEAKRYVTWRPFQENRALADEPEETADEEDELLAQIGEPVFAQKELKLCLQCQQEVNKKGKCGCVVSSAQITVYLVQQQKAESKKKQVAHQEEDVKHLQECGRCHSKGLKGNEIATEITLNSALTPLAILTEDLYRELPTSAKEELRTKPGGGRKLLSFYDSRQGAARFAAFVQDVMNQQAYRRLIYQAVGDSNKPHFWPALQEITDLATEYAIEQEIPHNDPSILETEIVSKRLSSPEKKQIAKHISAQLLAEITTGLRSRLSLETLGLMAVQYFEPNQQPPFHLLAQKLGLTEEVTRCLVEHLLDDLRRKKIVKFPAAVPVDHEVFGRNKFEWFLVKGEPQKNHQHSWQGQTVRYRRRRLVQKLLKGVGRPCDDQQLLDILNEIFNWLTSQTDLFNQSNPALGYQLRYDRLFFQTNANWFRCNKCQRLSCRSQVLPCPHPNCEGQLKPVTLDDENFYYHSLHQPNTPLRIEEHTAQLSPSKGREYQNKFKSGEINMLSCSTTFEMGIDLGDLQAVVMSNIPPTVANYKQRAGRAGRRTSGTAFILAWASNRPHDQAYFDDPAEIIGGVVQIPYLAVDNPIITQRHLNAILLSEFLRHCDAHFKGYEKNLAAFFGQHTIAGGYYSYLTTWLATHNTELKTLLSRFDQTRLSPEVALQQFQTHMRHYGFEKYEQSHKFYNERWAELTQQISQLGIQSHKESEQLSKERHRIGQLNTQLGAVDTINFLSDKGVLPSYSFPLNVVELALPYNSTHHYQLRLQRDARQAIIDYAPGQEVVADKRIWQSEGLEVQGKVPETYAYHICPHCNYLRLEKTAGKPLNGLTEPCPICNQPPKVQKTKRGTAYIKPDGFRTSNKSGQPAGQYVDRPYNITKSGLIPNYVEEQPAGSGSLLSVGYDRQGTLLYVNEGLTGQGFLICLKCGKSLAQKTNKNCSCGEPITLNNWYMLGFEQTTDTLHFKFKSNPFVTLPTPENITFWTTLKYALLQGASLALQIERRDIDGVLFPERTPTTEWQQTIVLYDNVPGGAGYVKRIQEKLPEVVAFALEIIKCQCETSCYRCLREYANQFEHQLLDRQIIYPFLTALLADLTSQVEGAVPGLQRVSALNYMAYLWQKVEQAQQEVLLFVQQLSAETPAADGRLWFDLLQQLLYRHLKVTLYVQKLPDASQLNLLIYLRSLVERGLILYQTSAAFPWTAVLDPHHYTSRLLQTSSTQPLVLGREGELLQETTDSGYVGQIAAALHQLPRQLISTAQLKEPAHVKVVEVLESPQRVTEQDFFADFYQRPVRKMTVSDRYLINEEQLLNRLGAHIRLAQHGGGLETVEVNTLKGDVKKGTDQIQAQAIQKLKHQFQMVKVELGTKKNVSHDRYILIERVDGTQARLIIGKGLDFIRPDGGVDHTFLIFEDPYQKP